jgi:hypothetical protein
MGAIDTILINCSSDVGRAFREEQTRSNQLVASPKTGKELVDLWKTFLEQES